MRRGRVVIVTSFRGAFVGRNYRREVQVFGCHLGEFGSWRRDIILSVIFTLPRPIQREIIVHTWEVETQLLRLILVGRGKGNTCGGDCYFSRALEEDFVGIFVGCVLQKSWRVQGLLGVDFGKKPFLGYGGFWSRSLRLILQHFLSTRGGVSSSSFPTSSVVFQAAKSIHGAIIISI